MERMRREGIARSPGQPDKKNEIIPRSGDSDDCSRALKSESLRVESWHCH